MIAKISDPQAFAALPEALQKEYLPQEDKTWLLKVDPVDGLNLGKIEGTMKALDAERKIREEKEKLLGTYVDETGKPIDPAKAREALKKIGEMATWKPEDKVREQINHLKAEMETGYAEERKAAAEKIAQLERGLTESIQDLGIYQGIATTKADPMIANVVRNMIRPEYDPATKRFVPRVFDEAGNLRYFVKGETTRPLSPIEAFEGWKSDPKFGIFFPGTGTSGTGGTSPGRGAPTGNVKITRSDARDHSKWQAAKKEAQERKVGIEYVDG